MAFKNVHILIYIRAFVICKQLLVQGAYYCSRNLARSPSYSSADFGLGKGIITTDRTPAFILVQLSDLPKCCALTTLVKIFSLSFFVTVWLEFRMVDSSQRVL